MKKNALIIAPHNSNTVLQLEKALLRHGFDTLRVGSSLDVGKRISQEVFSIIICMDEADGSIQQELVEKISAYAFGVITPILVLGTTPEPKDRTALTSLLDQYFPATTDPQVLAEYCSETHLLRCQKAKRGQLDLICVPGLLQQAATLKLNGAIVVERLDEKCIIYMESGYVVFASSNRDENRFGEFLVQQGIISREDFSRTTKILQASGKRFGNILVEEGIIKSEVLQTLIQSQVKHIIYNVFDWTSGEFYILFEEKSDYGISLARFEVASLVLEGVRYKFDEKRLSRALGSLHQRIRLTTPLGEIHQDIHLGKSEVDFLSEIGPGRSCQELLHLRAFGRLESLKLLYAFWVLGLIVFEPLSDEVNAEFREKQSERARAVDELFDAHKESQSLDKQVAYAEEEVTEKKTRRSKHRWRGLFVRLLVVVAVFLFGVLLVMVQKRWVHREMERKVKAVVTEKLVEERKLLPPHVDAPEAPESIVVPKVEDVSPTIEKKKKTIAQGDNTFQELMTMAADKRRAGEFEQALSTYKQALKRKPLNIEISLAMGDMLFELERFEESREIFGAIVKRDPGNARSHLALGTIFLMQGKREQARDHLRKYLSVAVSTEENQRRITEAQKILQSLETDR